MKAVILKGRNEVAVEDRPEPRIVEPTNAIVRVTMATICGTDLRIANGSMMAPSNIPMGHEHSGIIQEVGAGVSHFKAGDRVVSPFSAWCGGCFYCKKGLLTTCEKREFIFGAQAEYVRVPKADAVLEKLPDAVSDTQAAFLSDIGPGTFAGLQLAGLEAGDTVAVVGCGPTGLMTQLLARRMGAARVFGVDHHDYRLAAAEGLGSIPLNFEKDDVPARVRDATGGRGADIAVGASGTLAGLVAAAALPRQWGTLLNLGHLVGEAPFPIGELAGKHVRFVPSLIPPVKNYMAPLIKMIANGVIDPSPIASHTLPLADAARGYDIAARRADGALKILVKP